MVNMGKGTGQKQKKTDRRKSQFIILEVSTTTPPEIITAVGISDTW